MPHLRQYPTLGINTYIRGMGLEQLRVSQNRVFPEPDEPITQQLSVRALAGLLGRVLVVRNSVAVRMMLFSNFGSMKGLMSAGVPHRADPYSSSRRNFLAFFPLIYTVSRIAAAPASPTSQSKRAVGRMVPNAGPTAAGIPMSLWAKSVPDARR